MARFLRSKQRPSLQQCSEILSSEVSAGRLEEVAEIVARLVPRYLQEDVINRYFSLWERHGFHLTPVNYYSPIPDTRELKDELWMKHSELPGIDLNVKRQLNLLLNVFPRFREEYLRFPHDPPADDKAFYFNNTMFSGTDALVLYCMVRHFRPRLIVEVGSGYSTRVLSEAAIRNGHTEIKCIEPHPDDTIGRLPNVTEVITRPVQDVDMRLFQKLGNRDILFVDTSHTVKCGGDLNYLCLEVVPRLRKGVIIHFHDIFLPKEYPKRWVLDLHIFYNEQYLVQALLVLSSGLEIVFLNSYMGLMYQEEMRRTFPNSPWWDAGGSCWIMRK